MRTDRAVVSVVATCIVAVVLATGPVGLLNLEAPGSGSSGLPGTGNATVEVLSQPDGVALEPTDDGQDLLALEVPPVTLTAANVSGNPLLSYMIALGESGIATDSVVLLGDRNLSGDTTEVVIERRLLQPGEVENVTRAELELRMRGNRTVTLFERTVPVDRPGG